MVLINYREYNKHKYFYFIYQLLEDLDRQERRFREIKYSAFARQLPIAQE